MSKTDEVKQYYEKAGMYNGYAASTKDPAEKSKYEAASHEAWEQGEHKREELEKSIDNEAPVFAFITLFVGTILSFAIFLCVYVIDCLWIVVRRIFP